MPKEIHNWLLKLFWPSLPLRKQEVTGSTPQGDTNIFYDSFVLFLAIMPLGLPT